VPVSHRERHRTEHLGWLRAAVLGANDRQRAAAIAAAAGIPISTHLYPEVAAHVMRVSETAHWLEWSKPQPLPRR
jgi:hypothetical protein